MRRLFGGPFFPLIALVVLAIAACGQGSASPVSISSHSPNPISNTGPTSAPRYLVLVQTREPTSRISFVDLGGHEVAGADFEEGAAPLLCGAGYVRPPMVRSVAGGAFFIDRSGVIRRLDLMGRVSEVVRLPVTNTQQQPYFAVSPDGTRVMASIVKVPGANTKATTPLDCPTSDLSKGVENFTAVAGGVPRSLGQGDFANFAPTVVAGWDATGPLGTLHTHIGTQHAIPNAFNGLLVRMDPLTAAAIGAPLGGADCQPGDRLPDGTLLCVLPTGDLAVRNPDGSPVWSVHLATGLVYPPTLAPDGRHIAIEGGTLGQDGSFASAPRPRSRESNGTLPLGWFDGETVLCRGGGPAAIEYYRLSSPGTVIPFPLSGRFAGVISGS